MSPRVIRALQAMAAALALAALVLLMLPPRVSLPNVPPPQLPEAGGEPDASAVAADLLAFGEIARSNVFSPDRRPPARRYIPPELQGRESANGTSRQPAPPRLFGVASGPGGAVALIDADPAIPGAEIYRVGDRVAGQTIISISDSSVVLRGSSGETTLRLPRSRGGS